MHVMKTRSCTCPKAKLKVSEIEKRRRIRKARRALRLWWIPST